LQWLVWSIGFCSAVLVLSETVLVLVIESRVSWVLRSVNTRATSK